MLHPPELSHPAATGRFLTERSKGLPFRLSFPSTLPHTFWDQAARPHARPIRTSVDTDTSTSSSPVSCSHSWLRCRPGDKGGPDEEHKLCQSLSSLPELSQASGHEPDRPGAQQGFSALWHQEDSQAPVLLRQADTCYRLHKTSRTQTASR